jgi:hypothetical protein
MDDRRDGESERAIEAQQVHACTWVERDVEHLVVGSERGYIPS